MRRAVPTISAATATYARSSHACERFGGERLRVEGDAGGVEFEDTAREVDGRDEAELVSGGGVDDGECRSGADDRDPVDAVGFEDEGLHRVVVRHPAAVGAGDCDCAGRVLAGERREQRCGREEGSGRSGEAGLFEEQAEIGRRSVSERGVVA